MAGWLLYHLPRRRLLAERNLLARGPEELRTR
jgi:hypothetical protein